MDEPLLEELTDAVYRAALAPAAWDEVMGLMRASFPSTAQTFYFLDMAPRRVRPVSLAGVEEPWLRSFNELYFAPDNPWIRLTRKLHRPGVVRTNERLDQVLGEQDALYRSSYYNEWMRPQGFKYTIGNTLLADNGVIANVTLFRPPDQGTFNDDEVVAFEALSRHMTRSLQMSVRLQRPESCPASTAALEAIPQAIALVDSRRRVLYANEAMEAVLRRRHGLVTRRGELQASDASAHAQFVDYLSDAMAEERGSPPGATWLMLPCARGHLNVRVVPVSGATRRSLPLRATYLLLATPCGGRSAISCEEIRKLYGCTASEARLAQLVGGGHGPRRAAAVMGIAYETARAYLKIVFHKTGVHTQAQLVARLVGDSLDDREAEPPL